MARYVIDQRSGCIAVRDSTLTDPDHNGCNSDDRDVVFYRHGYIVRTTCPTCHHTSNAGWAVKPEDVDAAVAECARLNAACDAEATFDRLAMGM